MRDGEGKGGRESEKESQRDRESHLREWSEADFGRKAGGLG